MKNMKQRGSIIVSILIVSMFLFMVMTSLIILANSNLTRAKDRVLLLEAQYAAESGADAAISLLNADALATYTGTGATEVQVMSNAQYKAVYTSTVTTGATNNQRIIQATGKVYRKNKLSVPHVTRRIKVTTERTSGSVVVSGMLSRNIIDVESGVKNIYGKDIFVNGYINMNKNTTNLIAENITVAGKNTGASNCSIGGSGNLLKPTTFLTPGQTKTKIRLGYNNCISPPGNSNNSNFDVQANQGGLGKVQSTYIPWATYMDATYTNAFNGCTDWTAGTSPRTIPSAGHTKMTHYPDSATNISASCGTSGDLNLGSAQYNITDHVHIRANLCAASGCSPTFYNPTATAKYIFVEGTINLNGITSAPGSGPIILVSYGADPASKASICPLGGAIYLGNSGTVNAPDVYFLAVNGLCMDKTKFSASPGFGGLSGKNIYISTNPGSPFDLALDTAFPLDQVPIDLAWHATLYQRL
jgi:hypothetical protein